MSRRRNDNRPAPLTPPDLDLRHLSAVMIDINSLTEGEMPLLDDAARIANVMAQARAWHQVPAASLPNDDRQLCYLLGYGRDLNLWRKIRSQGALAGFIECSDDRLYHAALSQRALKAGTRKTMAKEAGVAAGVVHSAKKRARKQTPPQQHIEIAKSDDNGPITEPVNGPINGLITAPVIGPVPEEKRTEENRIESVSSPRDARAYAHAHAHTHAREGEAGGLVLDANARPVGQPPRSAALAVLSRTPRRVDAYDAESRAVNSAFRTAFEEVYGEAPKPDPKAWPHTVGLCETMAALGVASEDMPGWVQRTAREVLAAKLERDPGDRPGIAWAVHGIKRLLAEALAPRVAEVVPLPVARDGTPPRKRTVGAMMREFREGEGKHLVQEGW
ncbi:hypothetical protein [Teichococcus aerofrigidensis]